MDWTCPTKARSLYTIPIVKRDQAFRKLLPKFFPWVLFFPMRFWVFVLALQLSTSTCIFNFHFFFKTCEEGSYWFSTHKKTCTSFLSVLKGTKAIIGTFRSIYSFLTVYISKVLLNLMLPTQLYSWAALYYIRFIQSTTALSLKRATAVSTWLAY